MAKNSRMMRSLGAVTLVVACVASQSASAGERLHFKAGTVSTTTPVVRGYRGTFSTDAQKPSHFFILQFKSKIQKTDHAALRSAGLKVLRYVPDDALLVGGTAEQVAALQGKVQLQATLPFKGEWKLSEELTRNSVFSANQKEKVLIRTLDAKLNVEIQSALTKLGAKVLDVSGRSVVAELTRAQAIAASEVDGIEWIQRAPKMKLMHALQEEVVADSETPPAVSYEELTGYESGTKLLNIAGPWQRGFFGANEKVAIADTGFDKGEAEENSDFAGRMSGQAFAMFSDTWDDAQGHGTHVAGSVAGDGKMSGGRLAGSAPKASVIMQGMWSPVVGYLTVPGALSELFAPAYSAGARIHSNSWGSIIGLAQYDANAVQVDEYAYANPEFLLIFAAGNSGGDRNKDGRVDPGTVSSPATAKNCLAVGASENLVSTGGIQKKLSQLRDGAHVWGVEPLASDTLSNNPNGLAAFSSRGPTADGRIKPDVVAPGTNILSLRSRNPEAGTIWDVYNSDYQWAGGTSMATPLTAGVAAIVREYLAQARGMSRPSAALVKNILMHTAFDIFPGQYGLVGKEKGQEILTPRPTVDAGYGRVDADRATKLEDSLLVDSKAGVGVSEMDVQIFRANRNGKLTATLVWTDAPGSPMAAKALVNDLKLEVIAPDGSVAAIEDNTNNVELVTVDAQPGDYEVRVSGVNIPVGGKQPFSLVVSLE